MKKFDGEKFSKAIRKERLIERNISLGVMEKETGISKPTLSRYESGEVPGLNNYITICEWISCGVDEFVN